MADNDDNNNGDQNVNNNNNLIDMDDDDDDEDDEDMVLHDNDTTLDGGVASDSNNNAGGTGSSSDCDIILFVYCKEALDIAPDHPIMRPGINVSIGLEKSTKLSAVFRRYVDFCNETGGDDVHLDVNDLEFVHCQLLSGSDTAEANALMKNDRIQVRKEQKAERDAEIERKRAQREADKDYFQQMRHLMSAKHPDVVLDCQGKRNQRVLSTKVSVHSAVVARRCPWLGNIIEQARNKAREERRKAEEEKKKDDHGGTPEHVACGANEIVDDEDEQMRMQEESRNNERRVGQGVDLIVDVEEDEDDDSDEDSSESDDASEPSRREDGSANIVGSSHRHPRLKDDILVVTIPNHPPEAIKILLEFCCTNRVIALGRDAFALSCKTKPSRHAGPVAPFPPSHHHTKKWPNGGVPRIDFSVALSAVKLAEEAGLKRLSLMCEIAASQLVSVCNVTEALFMSTSQKSLSGNDLPRLRKAAMEVILRRGQRGVSEIGRSAPFKKALQEQRAVIVPTLLQGTMETVTHWENAKGAKKVTFDTSYSSFDAVDRADAIAREKERRKRRRERGASDPGGKRKYDSDNYSSEGFDEWETETTRKSLKRMRAHNLDAVTRRRTRASSSSMAHRTSQRSSRKRRSRV